MYARVSNFESDTPLTITDLAALAIHLDHQRRGLAGAFLNEGLHWADQDNLPVYLEATPEGQLLYPKFGFEKRDEFTMLEDRHIVQLFVRPARQPHASDG